MEIKVEKTPLALIVDDDSEMNKLMKVLLNKLGLHAETFTEPKKFLKNIKNLEADVCFIDLNIVEVDVGFHIIKAIRSTLGPILPLLVISGRSDEQSIAHAIELGANDYIVKPIDRELLASKIAPYISSKEITEARIRLYNLPKKGYPAEIDCNLFLDAVDEFGIKLIGDHLISKGTVLNLRSDIFKDILGIKKPVAMQVTSNWVVVEKKQFAAYLEFDPEDKELALSARRWIQKQAGEDL